MAETKLAGNPVSLAGLTARRFTGDVIYRKKNQQ
jgi:hypothetical protein